MTRSIFGSKKELVVGRWKKLHSIGLYNFYSAANVISVIKSRVIKLEGHLAWKIEVHRPTVL